MVKVFLLLAAGATANMHWQELMVHDCKGGMHIAPNTPLEFNLNMKTMTLFTATGADMMFSRAQCMCPGLTETDYLGFIQPSVEMGLGFIRGQDQINGYNKAAAAMAAKCPNWKDALDLTSADGISGITELAKELRKWIPPSCTYERYTSGKGCAAQVPVAKLDLNIQVVIAKCEGASANNPLPYFSVQCSGNGCADLGKPCSEDTDCGLPGNNAVKCHNVIEAPKSSDLFGVMNKVKLFPTGFTEAIATASSYCPSMSTNTPGLLGMITKLQEFFRSEWYLDSSPMPKLTESSSLGFCFWNVDSENDIGKEMEDAFKSTSDAIDANEKATGFKFFPLFPVNSALTTSRLNGDGFTTPPIAQGDTATNPLIYENCGSMVGFSFFNKNLGGAGQFALLGKVFGQVTSMFYSLNTCNAAALGLTGLTKFVFREAWELWQMDTHLWHWTTGAGTKYAGGGDVSTSPAVLTAGWGNMYYMGSDAGGLEDMVSNLGDENRRRLLRANIGKVIATKMPQVTAEDRKQMAEAATAYTTGAHDWLQKKGVFTFFEQAAQKAKNTLTANPALAEKLTQAREFVGRQVQRTQSNIQEAAPTFSNKVGIIARKLEDDSFFKTIKTTMMENKGVPSSSCTYQTQQTKGQCYNTWSGLNALLGTTLKPHIQIDRCRNPDLAEGASAWGFGMSGPWTNAIKTPTPCSTNSDCGVLGGGGLICLDMGSTDLLGNADLLKGYQEALTAVLYKSDVNTGTCLSQNEMFKEVRSFMLTLSGKDSDNSPSLKFCTPDYKGVTQKVEDNFETWLEGIQPTKKQLNAKTVLWTLPFIEADTAMNYPDQETENTFAVKTTTQLGGLTAAKFNNQQAAAFKAAYAASVGVEASNVEVKLSAKQPTSGVALDVEVRGVQGTAAATKVEKATKSAVGNNEFVSTFNQEMANFGGVQNDVAVQQSSMTAFYAANPQALPVGITADQATSTVNTNALVSNSQISAAAVAPMETGQVVVNSVTTKAPDSITGEPGATINTTESGGLGAGSIAGIVIGALAALALIVIAVILVMNQTTRPSSVGMPAKSVVQTSHATSNPVGMASLGASEGPEEL